MSGGPETKICVACQKELLIVEFRPRADRKDGVDSHCMACRRKANRHYRERHAGRIRNDVVRLPVGIEDRARKTRAGFIKYMQANPVYFSSIFRRPPTPENINRAYLEATTVTGEPKIPKKSTSRYY